MEYVSKVMFWISNGLLVPVIVGLLFFFIKSILMLGSIFNQYLKRNNQDKAINDTLKGLDKENILPFERTLEQAPKTEFTTTALQLYKLQDSEIHRNRQITDFEIASDKVLGSARTLTKFGPILGLMGTLIPMGPALVGLAAGDIGSMAYNMQIVFATTVLGLFTGAVGFVLVQVRQRWMLSDLTNLDFISDLITQHKDGK